MRQQLKAIGSFKDQSFIRTRDHGWNCSLALIVRSEGRVAQTGKMRRWDLFLHFEILVASRESPILVGFSSYRAVPLMI